MLLTSAVLTAVLIAVGVVVWIEFRASHDSRFLNTSEAQRLAASRFQNYNEGTREIEIEVTDIDGVVAGEGVFDYATGTGVAKLESADGPNTLIWWNYDTIGERVLDESEVSFDQVKTDLNSADGWSFLTREEATPSTLGAAMIFIAGFGFDRPDNPKLIEQSDAVWLSDENGNSWVQLPSADEVRGAEATPTANQRLPQVLIDGDGMVRKARIGNADSLPRSEVRFGSTVDERVKTLDVGAITRSSTGASSDSGDTE